jgi:hypothetical protein
VVVIDFRDDDVGLPPEIDAKKLDIVVGALFVEPSTPEVFWNFSIALTLDLCSKANTVSDTTIITTIINQTSI